MCLNAKSRFATRRPKGVGHCWTMGPSVATSLRTTQEPPPLPESTAFAHWLLGSSQERLRDAAMRKGSASDCQCPLNTWTHKSLWKPVAKFATTLLDPANNCWRRSRDPVKPSPVDGQLKLRMEVDLHRMLPARTLPSTAPPMTPRNAASHGTTPPALNNNDLPTTHITQTITEAMDAPLSPIDLLSANTSTTHAARLLQSRLSTSP